MTAPQPYWNDLPNPLARATPASRKRWLWPCFALLVLACTPRFALAIDSASLTVESPSAAVPIGSDPVTLKYEAVAGKDADGNEIPLGDGDYDWSFSITAVGGGDTPDAPANASSKSGTVDIPTTTAGEFTVTTTLNYTAGEGENTTKSANATVKVVEIVSVDYNDAQSVWKDSEITWDITTFPADQGELASSTSLGTLEGAAVTYNCPTSSASVDDSERKKPTVTLGSSSVSATSGPIVYEFDNDNLHTLDPQNICQGDGSLFKVSISPASDGSPPITYTGPSGVEGLSINSSGAIATEIDTSSGVHEFTARGNSENEVTKSLSLLPGAGDEWTNIFTSNVMPPNLAKQNYIQGGVMMGGMPGNPIQYNFQKQGELHFDPQVHESNWIEAENCGTKIAQESSFTYSAGVSAGFSIHGVGLSSSFTASTTVKQTNEFGGDLNRRVRARQLRPQYELKDRRLLWMRWPIGLTVAEANANGQLIIDHQDDWVVHSTINEAPAGYAVDAQCCSGGPSPS